MSQISVLIIIIYIIVGILNPLLIELSIGTYLPKETSLNIWIISNILRIMSIWIIVYLHYAILVYEDFKFIPIPIFLVSLTAGLVFSMLFSNALEITQSSEGYRFFFSTPLFYGMIFFDLLSLISLWIVQIRNFSKLRNKRLGIELNLILFSVTIIIGAHGIFNLTQILFFWYLHILLYIGGGILVLYTILKRPEVFIILTSKIYQFIIFHKSGILLYSYNFTTGEEEDESVIKGTILIGINHILSHLSEKRSMLNLIKMPHRDILLEYDGELGYAVLLITNKKNSILEKSLEGFMNSFSEINSKKFENMNGLIDVSEFKETKQLIEEYFEAYLPKN
ncbi:MAG: hypothetical protein ACOC4M_10850 [Promethearchaeia archaeon]